MSDIKLFRILNGQVGELESQSIALEKSLHSLIERHLDARLGVRFLASEYPTGKTHAGRIDTLGIDENGCPVIIEYKRSSNQNVINQGLFYLDWLLDHKAELQLLVQNKFGHKDASEIEWSGPRLLCIARDFTKYDEHAVQQINRNIELIRYRKYGDELLLFELVNVVTAAAPVEKAPVKPIGKEGGKAAKSVDDYLERADGDVKALFESLKEFALHLGDDVQMKTLKWYIAFRRLKNFACVEINPQKKRLLVFVKVEPSEIVFEDGFSKDVSEIGHYGTGNVQLTITGPLDLQRALPLIQKKLRVKLDGNKLHEPTGRRLLSQSLTMAFGVCMRLNKSPCAFWSQG